MNRLPILFLSILALSVSACGRSTSQDGVTPPPPGDPSACVSTQTCGVILDWDYTPEALATISGFKIYYGTKSNQDPEFHGYDTTIIADKQLTATVLGLGADPVLYFVVTAFSDNGESVYSNEVMVDFVEKPAIQRIQMH